MITLIKRNLKLFFRDKAGVFFSLLAVLITIVLYMFFISEILLPDELKPLPSSEIVKASWIAAGLLTTASVTTTLGAAGAMINDRERKIERDFRASPVSSRALTGGYLLSTFSVGALMTTVTFALSIVYIVSKGGSVPQFDIILKVLGVILLSVFAGTAIVTFIVSFLKSNNAFIAANTVIGTLIGFLTGIFIPMGVLPDAVQNVVRAFPLTYAASLFRKVLVDEPMAEMFEGAPAELVNEFREVMGITLKFGDNEVSTPAAILVLLATAAAFYVLSLVNISRRNRSR